MKFIMTRKEMLKAITTTSGFAGMEEFKYCESTSSRHSKAKTLISSVRKLNDSHYIY